MTVPIVTVRGEARLEGPPDLAGLSFTLHASGDSAEATRAQLATGSQAVAALLERFKGALERSSTSGLHVSPTFNHRNPTKITGYTGTFTSALTVADFDALSDLILALSALPNAQVDGPWWSLQPDNPLYREVRLAALAESPEAFVATVSQEEEFPEREWRDRMLRSTRLVAEVRRRADDYAAAFGTTVADLVEVSDLDGGQGGWEPQMARGYAESLTLDSSFSFEPAQQTVHGHVTVRFTLASA